MPAVILKNIQVNLDSVKESSPTSRIIAVYLAAIGLGELLIGLGEVRLGVAIHSILVFALYNQYLFDTHSPLRKVWPALGLVPLARLLGLVVPVPLLPPVTWYILIATPLWLAMHRIAKQLDIAPPDIGLVFRWNRQQILAGLSGIGWGLAAFLLLHLKPRGFTHQGLELFFGPVILLLFASFTEELIFRGFLQHILVETFGIKGTALTIALYALTWIPSRSPGLLLFFSLFGIFSTWFTHRLHSLVGMILCHGLLLMGITYFWPLLWK